MYCSRGTGRAQCAHRVLVREVPIARLQPPAPQPERFPMRKTIDCLRLSGVCLAVYTLTSTAATSPGLYNSGVNDSRQLLANGAVDPHFRLVQSADASAPGPNAFGTATITVAVNDGQYGNNLLTRTFTVTVNPVNDAPTLNAIANVTLDSSAGPKSVTMSGISSGAANEIQPLIVTATSSNPLLVPAPIVSYVNGSSAGALTLAPGSCPPWPGSITIRVTPSPS